MKTRATKATHRQGAYALLMVMVFGGVSILILAGAMNWTTANTRLIERNNQYFTTVAAAEAATEKVLTAMSVDFQRQGASVVSSKGSVYRKLVPTASENPIWGKYEFRDGRGNNADTYVEMSSPWAVSPLVSQHSGLSGYAASYRIVSHARDVTARYDVIGAVQQDIQTATVPIFQFAIFYNMDLEINPGPDMIVSGRVHSNGNVYSQPGASLTFLGDVTASGDVIETRMPGDPSTPSTTGKIVHKAEYDGGKTTLNLPLGTDNSPDSVRQIVEVPPVGESATSTLGQQRFYNKADLVILVRDTGIEARSGASAPIIGSVNLGWTGISSFAKTNLSFYNKREGKTVKGVEIDVAQFKTWTTGGNALKTALGRDVNSIYVADLRSSSKTSGAEPGVRLINGQTLPSQGLTVATPDPLYVKGHYNAPTPGSSNTSNTKPASLVADAINILSVSWIDANAGSGLSSRTASDTTVNAAFLAGIVPTGNGFYSGGVENFPRFLESWDGKTFTYNGSMIVMFPSRWATGPWKGTGSTVGVYNAPTRNWSFDNAFLDPNRLPPGTPAARTLIRNQWKLVGPNT